MYSVYPVDVRLVFQRWLEGLRQLSPVRLCLNQVYLCQELVGVQYLFHVGAHLVGEHRQDADDLPPLLCLQLSHFVVRLYHLGRLDEHRLTCSRLVVYDAVDAPFHLRGHGNHQSPVAHSWSCVLIHKAVLLCCVQYSI